MRFVVTYNPYARGVCTSKIADEFRRRGIGVNIVFDWGLRAVIDVESDAETALKLLSAIVCV